MRSPFTEKTKQKIKISPPAGFPNKNNMVSTTKKAKTTILMERIPFDEDEQRPEVPTTVVNLSGIALSEAEINLLSKGLSFCPTPLYIEKE